MGGSFLASSVSALPYSRLAVMDLMEGTSGWVTNMVDNGTGVGMNCDAHGVPVPHNRFSLLASLRPKGAPSPPRPQNAGSAIKPLK